MFYPCLRIDPDFCGFFELQKPSQPYGDCRLQIVDLRFSFINLKICMLTIPNPQSEIRNPNSSIPFCHFLKLSARIAHREDPEDDNRNGET